MYVNIVAKLGSSSKPYDIEFTVQTRFQSYIFLRYE